MESLMAYINAIVHQLMKPINFQLTSILTTFKTKCSIITCFHEKYCIEAEIEAAVVATLEETISVHDIKDHHTD